jgi:integrase/recombinase XerD
MRKKHLTTPQHTKLIDSALNNTAPPCMILFGLLATTAMRAEELARILLSDIDPKQGSIRISGAKGSHDRHLYIPKELMHALIQRCACIGLATNQSIMGILHDGFKDLTTPKQRHNAKQCLREHWRSIRHRLEANDIPMHGLRHTVAVAALEGGLDIRKVQAILGHKNINNTIKYLDYVNSLDASKDLLGVMSSKISKVG